MGQLRDCIIHFMFLDWILFSFFFFFFVVFNFFFFFFFFLIIEFAAPVGLQFLFMFFWMIFFQVLAISSILLAPSVGD